jgi:hypothetical protein
VGKDDDEGSSLGWTVAKGGLMVLGGLAALGIILSYAGPIVLVAAVLGAGYLGYRLYGASNKKAIEGGSTKALGSGKGSTEDDFARRMAELDALEKKLDAQIKDR